MKEKENSEEAVLQILIAEDSPTQAEQLRYALEKNNYKVIVAKDGKMALSLTLEKLPAIVISDIVMPEMNGYELCKAIKSDETTSDIPVILLTSLSNSEDVLEGLACGADNFLTKPYSEKYLLSIIDQIIANREFRKGDIVRVGVEISIGGKKRFITANQQQMLSLLISSYDAAVQKNIELVQTQEELRTINEHLEELVEERTADLTDEIEVRKSAEKRINKLNRVYAVLSNINQTIVRIHETNDLLSEACRIAVEDGKFQSAWIGTVAHSSNEIQMVAAVGLPNNLTEISLDKNPIIDTIRLGKHFISNNISTNSDLAEGWKHTSISLGFKSFGVFPIIVMEKVIGGFAIYSDEVDFFDEIEIALLDEMVTDISFALDYIQKEAARKLAEESLKQSELKYKEFFDDDLTGDYIATVDGAILVANPAMARIFGFDSVDELLKYKITSFYKDPLVRDHFLDLVRKSKKIEQFESEYTLRDGRIIYAIQNVIGVFEENGELVGVKGYLFDNTQRKMTEDELIIAKEKAEESDRLKTAFLHNISHEVRTPMNAIIGFSGFLSDPTLTYEKQSYFIDIITQSCYQLLSIITDIISIATIEAGQESIAENQVDLNSAINQIYELFLPKSQAKGLTLISKNLLSNEKLSIISDETKLLQILTKIIDNAIKFTKEGYVNFGFEVNEKELKFFVEDTGIGIPLEMQQEIFKRFSQVESTGARDFGGSGLGLSISKAYVELLGGRVWLKSELGKGSTFYITIPYKKAIAKIVADKQPKVGAKEAENLTKTLLIAEDEESNYMLLKEILANLNLNLVWAKNGEEAISICKEQEIDLILMDLKMPVMDGFEATMKIKDFKPNMPIIAQTAYSTDFDRNKAFGCGCTDYISKPFKMDFIISKIKENLK